jgi:hypothetical protein
MRKGEPRTGDLFSDSQWRQPETITVFADLPDNAADGVRNLLAGATDSLGLDQLPGVHFFRAFVIASGVDAAGAFPTRAVISAVFDGETDEFFSQWCAAAHDRIVEIFHPCADFPSTATSENVCQWLQARAERPKTYHIGPVRSRASEVREEARLRSALGDFIAAQNTAGAWQHGDLLRIWDDIRAFVRSRVDLPQTPRVPNDWFARVLQTLDLVKRVGLLLLVPGVLAWLWLSRTRHSLWSYPLAVLGFLAAMFSAWAILVRIYELAEPDVVVKPAPGQVAAAVVDEDKGFQNQFTMLTPVRDSFFRRLNLRFVLWLADGLSRHFWNGGQLAGIETIHFARFHQIDGGRRMFFMSDFDGSWERYLFDFVEIGSLAVVPIWTNLRGCPKTRFLRWTTPGFEQRFLPFTRAYQIRTHFWYSAMSTLTVSEINRNADIRAGLFQKKGRRAIQQWLQLI